MDIEPDAINVSDTVNVRGYPQNCVIEQVDAKTIVK